MKISLALAGAALLGGVLAGCGGGDDGGSSGDYCKDIKDASTTFGSLSGGDVADLDDVFDAMHSLSKEAPSEVKDDWKTMDEALGSVEKALSDAGLKFSDLANIQKGKIPKGADMSKLTGLASEFAKISNAKFTKASENIEKHAKDVCKVDLGSSS